jgi:hypothetical protein
MRSRTSAALVSWFQNPFGDSKDTAADAETDSVERLTAERWPDFVSSAGDNLCVVDYYTKVTHMESRSHGTLKTPLPSSTYFTP